MIDTVGYLYYIYLYGATVQEIESLKQWSNVALTKIYGSNYRVYKSSNIHFDLDLDIVRRIEIL